MKKNLDIFTKSRYGEPIFSSPLALRYFEVPLYSRIPLPSNKIEGRGGGAVDRLALDFPYVLPRNPLKTDTGKI